jgi:hypothetical protein
MIDQVSDINHWIPVDQVELYEGQLEPIYIQLMIGDIRYISPATSLGISIKYISLDTNLQHVVSGVQPFANDKSIWQFNLTQLPKSGGFEITITEDGIAKKFKMIDAIAISYLNDGGC